MSKVYSLKLLRTPCMPKSTSSMETITAKYLATNNSSFKHIPWKRSRTAIKHWKTLWRIRALQTQWYTMAHKKRSDQAQNSNPTWESTASMVIHQKGNIPTKIQQKALFGNCAKNGIEKCLEHIVQDKYGATDTNKFPSLCNWRPAMPGDCRDEPHLS